VTGRTRSNKIVNFPGDMNLVGKLIPVKIIKAYAHSLRGEMASPSPQWGEGEGERAPHPHSELQNF